MAKILLVAAFLAVSVYAAEALECYTCDHCSQDVKTWNIIPACGNVAQGNSNEGVCAKIIAKDKTGGENVMRKCVIAKKTANGPQVDCMRTGTEDSRECHICSSDLCNGVPSVNLSFFAVLGAVSVYLFQKLL